MFGYSSLVSFISFFKTVFIFGIPSSNFEVPSFQSECPLSYPSEKSLEFSAPSSVRLLKRIHAHSNAHRSLWSWRRIWMRKLPHPLISSYHFSRHHSNLLSLLPLFCSPSGTLLIFQILKDFYSVIHSLMRAPHWAPVSQLSFFIRAGTRKKS